MAADVFRRSYLRLGAPLDAPAHLPTPPPPVAGKACTSCLPLEVPPGCFPAQEGADADGACDDLDGAPHVQKLGGAGDSGGGQAGTASGSDTPHSNQRGAGGGSSAGGQEELPSLPSSKALLLRSDGTHLAIPVDRYNFNIHILLTVNIVYILLLEMLLLTIYITHANHICTSSVYVAHMNIYIYICVCVCVCVCLHICMRHTLWSTPLDSSCIDEHIRCNI